MRLLKPLFLALFGLLASVGLAQIPTPQINLSGNIGCQGFPCLNNGTLIMASDANRTMTALETSAMYIKVTSSVSLTATRNLIAPAGRFNFTIENSTTGGQSIQIIGTSGTGITIANGTTVGVWNDGTNFVQIGSSGSGFTAGGDLSGSSSSQTVIGLDTVPFCSGYTPTNGQFIQLTTGGSPNPCYTAATGTGTTSPGGTTGQIQYNNSGAFGGSAATITSAGAATIPSVNTVINAGTSLSTAVSSCGSANTTIQITQTIAVGTGITVPVNCTLLFQSAGNLTGTSITINGAVQSPARQIFGSGLAVTFGTAVTSVPLEWFGGKNDATGSTGVGTDNLTAFNAAIAALNAGQVILKPSSSGTGFYRITGPIVIAKPNVGIQGITGLNIPAVPIVGNGSTILIDGASEDAIDVNPGAAWNEFRDFNIYRTILATGTAKGLAVIGTPSSVINGTVIEGMDSQDSVYDFYCKGCQSAGTGRIAHNRAGWALTGLVATAPSGGAGWWFDSSDGTLANPLEMTAPNFVDSGTNGAGLTGLLASGINLSEMHITGFRALGLDYGMDFEITGTSNFVGNIIHINEPILDVCAIACLKANGTSSADVTPGIILSGGVIFATGTSPTSVGILVQNFKNFYAGGGIQFVTSGNDATANSDVRFINADGFQMNDSQFNSGSLVSVSCSNSTHGTINGNQFRTENVAGTAAAIKLVGCTNVAIQGNSISGQGTGALLNAGITFDSGSSNNGPWSLNTIDATTVTTPVADAGTNNNILSPTKMFIGSTTYDGNGINAGTGDFTFSNYANLFLMAPSGGGGNVVIGAPSLFDVDGTIEFSALSGCLSANATTHIVTGSGSACGGTATVIQVNGTPTTTATPVNLQTSTANAVGLTITPSNPSVGNVKMEITGATPSFGTSVTAPTHIGTIPGSSTQGAFAIGALPYSDTGIGLSIAGNSNSYIQGVVSNANAGTSASADFIVSNDQGTATTHYGDFGINSSAFSGSGNLTGIAGETYVYGNGGDLGLGTLTNNPVHLVVNNNGTDSITLNTGGTVSIPSLNSGGLTKSIVSSGLLSIAVPGTDYQIPVTQTIFNTFLTSPGPIGGTAPAAGTFTLLGATSVNRGTVATIASASTIAPTTPIILLTGSTVVHTITPPTGCTTSGTDCELVILTDASGPPQFANDANILLGYTLSIDAAITIVYDPGTSKWYPAPAPGGGSTPSYPQTVTGCVSGGILYGSATTTVTCSPAGTAGHLVSWGGAATAPTFDAASTIAASSASATLTLTNAGGGNTLSIGTNSSFDQFGTFTSSRATTITNSFSSFHYFTGVNCAGVGTSASPSVVTCTTATSGAFSCAVAASGATCTINTSGVTANSEITVQEVAYVGTRLGVTCNTAPTSIPTITVASIVAATSFTINVPTILTNPACYVFNIIN